MDNIKAIPGYHPFQVNTANEATDEERRRELSQKSPKKKNTVKTPVAPTETKTESPIVSGENGLLNRQMIDSESVVELLATRPIDPQAAKKYLATVPAPLTSDKSNFPSTKR